MQVWPPLIGLVEHLLGAEVTAVHRSPQWPLSDGLPREDGGRGSSLSEGSTSMGRHRTPAEKRELGERARDMRGAGLSRRQIISQLGVGEDLLTQLLSGIDVPSTLRRPRAKDGLRAQAVALRTAGASYGQIAAQLGVSTSSCSLWLRHLPRPEADPQLAVLGQARRLAAARARAARDRAVRDSAADQVRAEAAASLGDITSRDLVLAAAVSYWCEGAKRKPWNRTERVAWMNSDPVLVRLFLEGLAQLRVSTERLSLRLHIHENADEEASRRWWSEQTGVALRQFRSSTIKRHNPRTRRGNVGEGYHGCLCVNVLGSRGLYQVFDGLVQGLATGPRSRPSVAP